MSDIIPGTKEYVAQNQVPDSSSPVIPIQRLTSVPEEKSPARLPESPWLPDEPEDGAKSTAVDEIDQMLKDRALNINRDPQAVVKSQPALPIGSKYINPQGQSIATEIQQSEAISNVKPRAGVDSTPVIVPEGLLDPQKPVGWWKKLLRRG